MIAETGQEVDETAKEKGVETMLFRKGVWG